MKEVAIVSAVQTPIGKFQGQLASFRAPSLGTLVIREAVRRSQVPPDRVSECIMGHVLQAGVGQNPARQAAMFANLPDTLPAVTVNRVCGSGLKSITLATQTIQSGDNDVVIAGGMESMSNAPYLLPHARTGFRMGNNTVVDSMIHDGLWDVYNDFHMGLTAEHLAKRYGISRDRQDAHAVESHRRAFGAAQDGAFTDEIVSIEIPGTRHQPPTQMTRDEGIRSDATMQALTRLKPVFKEDGTVTAGNASGVSDGASAVVLMSMEQAERGNHQPLAIIRAHAASGIEPSLMGIAPVQGIQRVLAKASWSVADVDLFELNEAFSVQFLAVCDELELDSAKVNVHGGSVALGHPIGASGARVLTTLLYALRRYNKRRGIAALCIGGGNSIAVAIEST